MHALFRSRSRSLCTYTLISHSVQTALRAIGHLLQYPTLTKSLDESTGAALIALFCEIVQSTKDRVWAANHSPSEFMQDNTCTQTLCNYALWCISAQRLPAAMITQHMPQIIQAVMLGLDGAFHSVVIKTQAIEALVRLFRTVPDAIVAQIDEWLLRAVLATVDHTNVRTVAEELLGAFVHRVVDSSASVVDNVAEVGKRHGRAFRFACIYNVAPTPQRNSSSSMPTSIMRTSVSFKRRVC